MFLWHLEALKILNIVENLHYLGTRNLYSLTLRVALIWPIGPNSSFLYPELMNIWFEWIWGIHTRTVFTQFRTFGCGWWNIWIRTSFSSGHLGFPRWLPGWLIEKCGHSICWPQTHLIRHQNHVSMSSGRTYNSKYDFRGPQLDGLCRQGGTIISTPFLAPVHNPQRGGQAKCDLGGP